MTVKFSRNLRNTRQTQNAKAEGITTEMPPEQERRQPKQKMWTAYFKDLNTAFHSHDKIS